VARSPDPSRAWSLPVPEWDADEPRQAIEEIMRQPGLRDDRGLFQRVVDQAIEWLGRILEATFGGGGGVVLAWVITAVLLAVVVFLVVRLVRGMQADPRLGGVTDDDIGRSAVDWRAEADGHEGAGRWRDAVRCRYRAVVADLAARGLVEEVPGRTAGTYRRLVEESHPAVAAEFGEMTELFERVWYGRHPAGHLEAGRVRELSTAVSATSGRGSRS
jgi:hypothetical protein